MHVKGHSQNTLNDAFDGLTKVGCLLENNVSNEGIEEPALAILGGMTFGSECCDHYIENQEDDDEALDWNFDVEPADVDMVSNESKNPISFLQY